jgi:hypothetical protein
MKLVKEIIENLSTDGKLTDALLKTKILMSRIDHPELAAWVNRELNGYGKDDELPDYRVVRSVVYGNASNVAWRLQRQMLPLAHLAKGLRDRFEHSRLTQSLGVIEDLANGKGTILRSPIPPELYASFNKGLGNGYELESAWCEMSKHSVQDIKLQVRSRLLDFLLVLDRELGDEEDEDQIQKRAKEIDTTTIFNNAVISGNVIIGDNNKQTVNSVIVKGDFSALSRVLQHNAVAEADIADLEQAIQADVGLEEPDKKNFGPKVKSWLKKMLGKAVDTSWTIELSIAANLLTDALKRFYGW